MLADPKILADRMEQLAASGNGQLPCVAALAWTILNT